MVETASLERADPYIEISRCEGSDGLGVRVCVSLPAGRQLTERIVSEIQRVGSAAFDWLHAELHNTDPAEIAGREQEKASLLALFGDRKIWAEPVANEYDRRFGRPWFVVTTTSGPVKIGWRKRVISIDWSRTTNSRVAEDLFASEATTKEGHTIHAWGYEAAARYLDVILA